MNQRPLRAWWVGFERSFAPQVPAARLGAFRAIVCLVALYALLPALTELACSRARALFAT